MQIAGKVLTEAFIRIVMSHGFCRAPSNSCACLSQQALLCGISKKRWAMESAIHMCWNSSWRFANKGGYGQKNISGIKEIVIRANGLTVSGMHGNAVCISLKRKNLK